MPFFRRWWLTICIVLVAGQSPALAQQPAAEAPSSPAASASKKAQAVITAADEAQLTSLYDDLVKRQAEYDAAIKELSQLQGDLAAHRKDHAALAKGNDAAAIAASATELEIHEEHVRLAQERVDLAITERKAVRALIAQLEKKIEEDRAEQRAVVAPATPSAVPAETPKSAASKLDPSTGLPSLSGADSATEAAPSEPLSARVAEATAKADEKSAEVTEARAEAEAVDKRKATLEANIALERKRLANSYQRHDNLSQTMIKLDQQLFRELTDGKKFADLADLSGRRDQTREQLTTLSQEIKDQSTRVEALQSQLLGLQQEQLLAAREVEEREAEAEVAQRHRWLVTVSDYAIVTLPRVALILVVLFVIYYGSRMLGRRLIAFLSRTERGTPEEKQYRTQTLTSVFENAVTTGLYVAGGLMILDTMKIPVGTLLGGVAVVGLAVAFGAQNLIRDFFYGFMILLEDQYKISDTVTINNMTGTVERITLRITVLRDFEGKVYFIPNGQVNSVINLTNEWSRVVLDIPVSYSEKIERVMGLLLELATALASEPAFKDGVLREPELFGVEKLGDSAVIVRLCLVTRPSQKDTVRRELLRRIKGRFDELGIEIPFPQQTIHFDRIHAQGETIPPENTFNGAGHADAAVEQA